MRFCCKVHCRASRPHMLLLLACYRISHVAGLETACHMTMPAMCCSLTRPADVPCVEQEVQVLARCRSRNITQYHASVLLPGSTELMIVMELMAASVFDVVSHPLVSRTA